MTIINHRSANEIMTLSRLGSFYQSKLSFLRSFIREFKDWDFSTDLFELDENGYGTAVYSVKKNDRIYSLVCFAKNYTQRIVQIELLLLNGMLHLCYTMEYHLKKILNV